MFIFKEMRITSLPLIWILLRDCNLTCSNFPDCENLFNNSEMTSASSENKFRLMLF